MLVFMFDIIFASAYINNYFSSFSIEEEFLVNQPLFLYVHVLLVPLLYMGSIIVHLPLINRQNFELVSSNHLSYRLKILEWTSVRWSMVPSSLLASQTCISVSFMIKESKGLWLWSSQHSYEHLSLLAWDDLVLYYCPSFTFLAGLCLMPQKLISFKWYL